MSSVPTHTKNATSPLETKGLHDVLAGVAVKRPTADNDTRKGYQT